MAIEFKDRGIRFEEEKGWSVKYKDKTIGSYKPDFIVEDKVILEIKAVPTISKAMMDQIYYYVN